MELGCGLSEVFATIFVDTKVEEMGGGWECAGKEMKGILLEKGIEDSNLDTG